MQHYYWRGQIILVARRHDYYHWNSWAYPQNPVVVQPTACLDGLCEMLNCLSWAVRKLESRVRIISCRQLYKIYFEPIRTAKLQHNLVK